jgi:uncharacterized Zn-binding protein involved in type VI secretion
MSHCQPRTAEGSSNTWAYSKQDHRNNDSRICGAKTIVVGQSTVWVNGRLWAVHNDICDHGNGQLQPTGTTVWVEGKLVIVHSPDPALPNNRCGAEASA